MNDLELSEIRKMKAEQEAYSSQLTVQQMQMLKDLKNGLGEDIRNTLNAPPPKISWFKQMCDRLWRVLN